MALETYCEDIQSLVQLGDVWKQFTNKLINYQDEWKEWLESENPERVPIHKPHDQHAEGS